MLIKPQLKRVAALSLFATSLSFTPYDARVCVIWCEHVHHMTHVHAPYGVRRKDGFSYYVKAMKVNLLSCVGVHSCKEVVYSEVCHDDAKESQGDIDVVGERLAEDRQALRVNYHGIYHEGDECPCLLAVPTPVGSPADICPDGSDEDAETHGCESRVEEYMAQCLQFLAMRV